MKTRSLKMVLSLIITIIATTITAQTVSFKYDIAGNRISQALVIKKINTSNNADSNDEQKSSFTSVETITIDDIEVSISPNPNGGKFEVSICYLGEQPHVEIYLHTMLGKQIYRSKQVQSTTTINITNYENGTYILTVIVNGTKEVWKVIKQ